MTTPVVVQAATIPTPIQAPLPTVIPSVVQQTDSKDNKLNFQKQPAPVANVTAVITTTAPQTPLLSSTLSSSSASSTLSTLSSLSSLSSASSIIKPLPVKAEVIVVPTPAAAVAPIAIVEEVKSVIIPVPIKEDVTKVQVEVPPTTTPQVTVAPVKIVNDASKIVRKEPAGPVVVEVKKLIPDVPKVAVTEVKPAHDETDRAVKIVENKIIVEITDTKVAVNDVKVAPIVVETPTPAPVIAAPAFYEADQWSPSNTDGKKYYTRDQLLKLRDSIDNHPRIKLPPNVETTLFTTNKNRLTDVLDHHPQSALQNAGGASGNIGLYAKNFQDICAPKFFVNQNQNNRNPYPKRPSQQGNKQMQGGGGGGGNGSRGSQSTGPMIKMSLSLKEDVKLNESQNAWKPGHLVQNAELTDEDRATEELYRNFRSVLNKLTPENFGVLVNQVKSYKIDNETRLEGCIKLVFEKAIAEPNFATTYAEMCKEVSGIYMPNEQEGKKAGLFKIRLITQCQQEFERHRDDATMFRNHDDRLAEIQENEQDIKKRVEIKTSMEEEHFKLRRRAVGTVKFIGELYKIDMLTSKIMRTCMRMLTDDDIVSEETIECLCKLLTTIGCKMETQDGPKPILEHFTTLENIIGKKIIPVCSRIRFMVQDVIDLRKNRWQLRRNDGPKTIGQIQREVETEQKNIQMLNYPTRGGQDDRRNQNNYNKRPQQQEEGWVVQQTAKARTQPIDFRKMTATTIDTSKLGQAAIYQDFMSNKFSTLAPEEVTAQEKPGSQSKNSSMERGDNKSRNYNSNNSQDQRFGARGSNQGSRNSSQIRSRDNSGSRNQLGGPSRSLQAPRHQQQQPPNSTSMASLNYTGAVPKEQALEQFNNRSLKPTDAELQKYSDAFRDIQDKYCKQKISFTDACAKMDDFPVLPSMLVDAYNRFFDRNDLARECLNEIIMDGVKSDKIGYYINIQALKETFDGAADLVDLDVPLVYHYIAQYLGKFVY